MLDLCELAFCITGGGRVILSFTEWKKALLVVAFIRRELGLLCGVYLGSFCGKGDMPKLHRERRS